MRFFSTFAIDFIDVLYQYWFLLLKVKILLHLAKILVSFNSVLLDFCCEAMLSLYLASN
jgi:hypothetical protein